MKANQLHLQRNTKKMHKVISIILFTFCLTLFVVRPSNATVKKPGAKIKTDTLKIEVKSFDAHALKQYKQDKDFNYNGEATGQPSLWDQFWDWVWDKITRLFKGVPYGGSILKYLLLGLSIAVLIYAVLSSIGIDPMRLWRNEPQKTNIPYSESIENIHEIYFDAEIEKAISSHNYRLAVRLLYLKSLKQLSDMDLIKWEINKTNSAYLDELKDIGQKQIFRQLTYQFEYVWYGNFTVDQQAFGNIYQLFQNFKNQLP